MRPDGQLLGQLSAAEKLDSISASVGQTGGSQKGLVHGRTRFELIQSAQIHGYITGLVHGVAETTFWNSPDQWHLTAFKTNANRAARSRGLAFPTTTAGLAVSTGFTLPEPLAAMLGPGSRFKSM